jgi:thiamine-monophosphate kinase
LATHPAARGLRDDAAVLEFGGRRLVLTHDVLAEGIHYLAADPPADVAWKLLAVNLSDLAAKGARPLGVLLGYPLASDDWNEAFVVGLGEALAAFDVPLLGGDTVAGTPGAPRMLGLTAIGEAEVAPSRIGAQPGDQLWVSGTIGDAGAGLRIASGAEQGPESLAACYRRPIPRLALGQALAPHVSAMMDVSDGLLIDAGRMAEASGVACTINLDAIPLSDALRAFSGEDVDARLRAATAGDDYELLFSAPPAAETALLEASAVSGTSITRIGQVNQGSGLSLLHASEPIPLPARLGWEHEVAPDGG